MPSLRSVLAKLGLSPETADAAIESARSAPALTDDQSARLRVLFRPAVELTAGKSG